MLQQYRRYKLTPMCKGSLHGCTKLLILVIWLDTYTYGKALSFGIAVAIGILCIACTHLPGCSVRMYCGWSGLLHDNKVTIDNLPLIIQH